LNTAFESQLPNKTMATAAMEVIQGSVNNPLSSALKGRFKSNNRRGCIQIDGSKTAPTAMGKDTKT
jgi:hypothetical protein